MHKPQFKYIEVWFEEIKHELAGKNIPDIFNLLLVYLNYFLSVEKYANNISKVMTFRN